MDDDDDATAADEAKLTELLARLGFADRYYAYCASHRAGGPDIPVETHTKALTATGKSFKYDEREKFFAWRAANPPTGCELGLNVGVGHDSVQWILVFKTPRGHIGTRFAIHALWVKCLTAPKYRHDPPYPDPRAANARELATVLTEGLALYDDIAAALAKESWN